MVIQKSRFVAAALASSAIVGATQSVVTAMPGRLVAVDAGHRLHIWCTGQVHLYEPEVVTNAIRQVLVSARTGRPLAARDRRPR